MDVKGKLVLVASASSGIGEASATALAQNGAILLLVARSKDKLTEVMSAIQAVGGRAKAQAADLSDPALQPVSCSGEPLDVQAGMTAPGSTATAGILHDSSRRVRAGYTLY